MSNGKQGGYSLKHFFILLIRLIVSVGILTYLFGKIDAGELYANFRRLSFSFVVVIFLLFFAQNLLSIIRWQIILKSLQIEMRFFRVASVWMEGAFFNQALPSVVGGDAFRIWRLNQAGSVIAKASAGVLLDRVFALKALLVIVLCLIPALFQLAVGDTIIRGVGIVITLALLGVLAGIGLYKYLSKKNIQEKWPTLYYLGCELFSIYKKPTTSLVVIGLSVAVHILSVIEIYTIGVGYGMLIDFYDCLIIIPPVLLALQYSSTKSPRL